MTPTEGMEDLGGVTVTAVDMTVKEAIMTQMMDKAIIEGIQEVITIPMAMEIPVDMVGLVLNSQEVVLVTLVMGVREFQI